MRQVISDFLDRLHNTAGTISLREESDKMVQIYSDERYSLNDLAAILEDDVTILLRELKSESAAIEHDAGNQCWENVYKSNTFLISGVIRFLIDRAAGVRVFLSDDFLSQHEDDIFLNTRFANYVRNEYKAKGKPQQKHIEAPQQPIGGNSGELAGNSKENAPAAPQQPIGIITINNTDLEISVYNKAITKEYMTQKPDGTYKWNKTNRLLAYMCGRLYCGDRVREDKSDYTTKYKKGRGKLPAKELKKLFGVDIGKTRDNIDVPGHYDIIDELFNN